MSREPRPHSPQLITSTPFPPAVSVEPREKPGHSPPLGSREAPPLIPQKWYKGKSRELGLYTITERQ